MPYEYTKGPGRWQVSWFSIGHPQVELAQVYVDDASGTVTEAWTGFQVAWTMARGYPGAFGRRVNSWYVWIPLCVLFVAPFLPWRRRPSLLHLDLLVLLGVLDLAGVLQPRQIGLSVPLAYPFLLYLLVRMLLLGVRTRASRASRCACSCRRRGWRSRWCSWSASGSGLNVTDSNVIDVGYAGVIGADKLLHGQHLYGGWPSGQRQRRHLRPGQLLRLRPVRVRSSAGAASGTTCRRRTPRRSRSTC